jgi:small subunit ribosomal protein S5
MAEKESKNKPKDLIEAVPEELAKLPAGNIIPAEQSHDRPKFQQRGRGRGGRDSRRPREDPKALLAAWIPKTQLGKDVKEGKIKDFDIILSEHKRILEEQIVDTLLNLESDLLLVGQAKGKFGGGKRRAWRQTQKKTMEGNVTTFASMAVVGDKNGHIGVGYGKAKETLPARAKALRQAKLNVIKIARGFESKEAPGSEPHTVPFIVTGKCGSVRVKLIPASRGTGLVIGDEGKKILKLVGIKDIYAVTKGQTRTTFNLAKAMIDALTKTTEMKL